MTPRFTQAILLAASAHEGQSRKGTTIAVTKFGAQIKSILKSMKAIVS